MKIQVRVFGGSNLFLISIKKDGELPETHIASSKGSVHWMRRNIYKGWATWNTGGEGLQSIRQGVFIRSSVYQSYNGTREEYAYDEGAYVLH